MDVISLFLFAVLSLITADARAKVVAFCGEHAAIRTAVTDSDITKVG
jgi:hypothetical protein